MLLMNIKSIAWKKASMSRYVLSRSPMIQMWRPLMLWCMARCTKIVAGQIALGWERSENLYIQFWWLAIKWQRNLVRTRYNCWSRSLITTSYPWCRTNTLSEEQIIHLQKLRSSAKILDGLCAGRKWTEAFNLIVNMESEWKALLHTITLFSKRKTMVMLD